MRIHWARPRSRFGLLQIYGLIALGGLLVARYIPIARMLQPWWGCAFRRVTGIPCMACGLTRAFDWTTHGRIVDAFVLTPLGALAPWICGLAALWAVAGLVARAPLPDLEVSEGEAKLLRYGVVGAVVANWLYMVIRTLVRA